MLNVNELESRYKKYKRSLYFPYLIFIAIIIIVLIFILLSTLYNENTEIKIEAIKPQIIIIPTVEEKNETLFEETNETVIYIEQNSSKKESLPPSLVEINETEEIRVSLAPSLDFIKKIKSQTVTKNRPKIVSEKKEIDLQSTELTVEEVNPKEQIIVQSNMKIQEKNPLHVEAKKSSINIERKDEESDIKDVIKRFNINHSPALSLFIAKKYYQLGNYELAYNYALITNDINNNIEGSWIIFAKSLVKMDKKKLAIETLKKYISHSHSSQARQLLDEIISGKFK